MPPIGSIKRFYNGHSEYVNPAGELIFVQSNGSEWRFIRALPDATTAVAGQTIANGARLTLGLGVAGAAFGDFVQASLNSHQNGLQLESYISSAGTVQVVLINATGGSVVLPASVVRVRVTKA